VKQPIAFLLMLSVQALCQSKDAKASSDDPVFVGAGDIAS